MKKTLTRIAACLLAVLMLFGTVACSSGNTFTEELDSLKESVDKLIEENEELKKQAIEAKEEIAKQQAALEALKKDSEESDKQLETILKSQYQLKVVDLDGEVLVSDTLYCRDSISLVDTLTNDYGMVSYESQYGTTIVSVSGSIVDPNYYVSITENGKYADVGVDGLVIDAGDIFEFKVECWNTVESGYGTMDKYDVLVDKAIYSYIKNTLSEQAATATSYTGSLYWDQAAVTFMASKGYDASIFKLEYSDAFKNAVSSADVSALSGNDFMKYYYAQKSLGNAPSDEFKSAFNTAIASTCTEWLLPVAKAIGSDSDSIDTLIASAPSTSMQWGPDMSIWSYVLLGLYADYDGYISTYTSQLDWGNGTSTALVLLAMAKDGINARSAEYEKDGKDIIEVLFDTYYDEELGLIKVYTTDTDANFSTNQIYASLMAYKACRDTGAAVNIFA
ncbi:MAG: hypothetical protein J6A83_00270 [Clostridia bacterium]|nr:hypothetical protein [Clostridia bacterium]